MFRCAREEKTSILSCPPANRFPSQRQSVLTVFFQRHFMCMLANTGLYSSVHLFTQMAAFVHRTQSDVLQGEPIRSGQVLSIRLVHPVTIPANVHQGFLRQALG